MRENGKGMASKRRVEGWLRQLTHLPTASGHEEAVIFWVTAWAARRDDLKVTRDGAGNLLITQKGRTRRPPVVAVAHMDHPAFVINEVKDGQLGFEFRGWVATPYFEDARVEVVSRPGGAQGKVVEYDAQAQTGIIRTTGTGGAEVGDIAMWRFRSSKKDDGVLSAPACDDLAGCAASLAALDRCRGKTDLRHFAVLLTRAEEVGLVGAVHAAKEETVPRDARILSIETSRQLSEARVGDGPVIRTGDRVTVFDRELTNRISRAAASSPIHHQRKLMSGGGCEATAFGAYGYQATGLCVPLGNWHNQGNLDEVEKGKGAAIPKLEEISLQDFHGLVDLILLAARAVDCEDPVRDRLDDSYRSQAHLLG